MEKDKLASIVGSLNESLREMLLLIAKAKNPVTYLMIRRIFELTKPQTTFRLQPLIMGRLIEIKGLNGNETINVHPDIAKERLIDLLQYSDSQ